MKTTIKVTREPIKTKKVQFDFEKNRLFFFSLNKNILWLLNRQKTVTNPLYHNKKTIGFKFQKYKDGDNDTTLLALYNHLIDVGKVEEINKEILRDYREILEKIEVEIDDNGVVYELVENKNYLKINDFYVYFGENFEQVNDVNFIKLAQICVQALAQTDKEFEVDIT